jgi:hypothetical protein
MRRDHIDIVHKTRRYLRCISCNAISQLHTVPSILFVLTISFTHLYQWRNDDAKRRNTVFHNEWPTDLGHAVMIKWKAQHEQKPVCFISRKAAVCAYFPAIWSVRHSPYARLLILAFCVYSLFVEVRYTLQCISSKVASIRTDRRIYQ